MEGRRLPAPRPKSRTVRILTLTCQLRYMYRRIMPVAAYQSRSVASVRELAYRTVVRCGVSWWWWRVLFFSTVRSLVLGQRYGTVP